MRYSSTLLTVLIICASFNRVLAQCNVNLLNNPGFDSPVQPAIGNNLTGLFTLNGWTMTGGPFNVIKTDGSLYGGGPDNAKDGDQYIDITNGAGIVYQDFTLTSTVPIGFGGNFSSREQSGSYVNWTASIDIVDLGTNTVVATSSTKLFTNADGEDHSQETWHHVFGNAVLPAGNYRFVANIGDFGNFDAAQLSLNCVLDTRVLLFSGSVNNGSNLLNWNCSQVNDLAYFEIQRSADGRNFTAIGNIAASFGTGYNFTDNDPLAAASNFYRIKIVDKNGRQSYSAILNIKTTAGLVLQVAPNPVTNNLKISGLNGKGQVRIHDITGRVVIQKEIALAQTLSLDVSALSKGMYILEYFDGDATETKKFSKQ
jgi:Secretion system C-terminal sorting domain